MLRLRFANLGRRPTLWPGTCTAWVSRELWGSRQRGITLMFAVIQSATEIEFGPCDRKFSATGRA